MAHAAHAPLEGRPLDAGERLWRRLPEGIRDTRVGRSYGSWMHRIVRRRAHREMYLGTQFLRNRPALELARRIVARRGPGRPVRVAVLGCSIGAEVYSLLWTLRAERAGRELVVDALDISPEVIELARAGRYGPDASTFVGASIFAPLSDAERREMFDWDGPTGTVKPWLRDGVRWHVADAGDPTLVTRLGRPDLVIASNFLCHLPPEAARACLRNIGALVAPGGHLVVTGVDLDVRTGVARELGWQPVAELREAIHEGDALVRADWPWRWWGLEPLDRRRGDWVTRYSAAFRVGAPAPGVAGPAGPATTQLRPTPRGPRRRATPGR